MWGKVAEIEDLISDVQLDDERRAPMPDITSTSLRVTDARTAGGDRTPCID
jgi:hypothetical protein